MVAAHRRGADGRFPRRAAGTGRRSLRPGVRPMKEPVDALRPPEAAKYNKFRNVVVAHQRAQQLKNGARPRVETGTHKFLWVAMREVQEGLISWDSPDPVVERGE
jgi:DNA-directed RNA polymerase omega subunit